MYDIKANFGFDESWTNIKCFKETDEVAYVVIYRRNVLTFATVSLKNYRFQYRNKLKVVLDNDIIIPLYSMNTIFILDSRGNIYSVDKTNEEKCTREKIGFIPCEEILSACLLKSGITLACISLDKHLDVNIQTYHLPTKRVQHHYLHTKKPLESNYILTSINTESSALQELLRTNEKEMILIGSQNGQIILCSPDCSYVEVFQQFPEPAVHIFTLEKGLGFILSDGCLVEHTHCSSMKYLPDSCPSVFLSISSDVLLYSDLINTFMFVISESRNEKLNVRGVIDFDMIDEIVFMLTLQGSVYVVHDSTSDQMLSKIEQLDDLNRQICRINADLSAVSMCTRASQLKCHFLTKLRVLGGDMSTCYQFKLNLMHKCFGVVFEKDVWSLHICLGEYNVMIPLTNQMSCGDIQRVQFALNLVPVSYYTFQVYLVSGPHLELKVPVLDSVVTLLCFYQPVSHSSAFLHKMKHERTVPLKDKLSNDNILHKVLIDIRHKFTKDEWEKLISDNCVFLKCNKTYVQLCHDVNNKTLRIKCSEKDACDTIARIVNLCYTQTNSPSIFYSDYLHLNSIKQQLQIDQFESNLNLTSTVEKLNSLQFM